MTIWLANALASRGFETVVFTASLDSGLWPEELLSNFSIHVLPSFSARFLVKRSNSLKRRLFGGYLSKALEGFDVIIPNNNPSIQWVQTAKRLNGNLGKVLWLCQEPTRLLFGEITDRHFFEYEKYNNGDGFNEHIAKSVRKRKLRIQKHTKKRARNARWEVEAAAVASTIIANSRFSAESIEKVFSRKAEIIYPGILPVKARNTARKREPGQDYICYVGRLSVMKNVDNVVEAFRILREGSASDSLSLKIVGEGPRREALEKKVFDYGLQDKVSFLGYIPDEELPGFIANARMTVYVPIDEPFGLVPLESLQQCTPVIVSDHGGPGEVFSHQENAYVVNPFDPEEIAKAISRCLKNGEEARHLAENGHTLVKSTLTLERFVDRLQRLF